MKDDCDQKARVKSCPLARRFITARYRTGSTIRQPLVEIHKYTAARDWKQAETVYNSLAELFPADSVRNTRIISLLRTPGEPVAVKNLGPSVNSRYDEYFPVITADEKT